MENILPAFSQALDSNFENLSSQLDLNKNEIIDAIN
jgi:hypothetical protein